MPPSDDASFLHLCDSITKLPADAAGRVIVSGSHGGRYPGYLAAQGRARGVIQLSGGIGPDGLAIDRAGNLAVAHAGLGTVWQFDRLGRPIRRIQPCAGLLTTNLAYGGDDGKILYITESATGTILKARTDTPGKPMFGGIDGQTKEDD